MKAILFTDNAAQDMYAGYMSKVSNAMEGTEKEFRNMILVEVHNYIQKGMDKMEEDRELVKMEQIIHELGSPYVYLKQFVVDNKLDKALKSYNLGPILLQLFQSAKTSLKYTVFFVLYILVFSVAVLVIARILFPAQTGFFVQEGGFSFGFIRNIDGATEVLDEWFDPFVLVICILLYLLLTSFIKLNRSQTKTRFYMERVERENLG